MYIIYLFKVKKYNNIMSEPKYVMLNPVCSVIDERNVWVREHESYLDFNNHIRWHTVYKPVKCYFSNIDIANIKDYALDKFLK